MNPLVATEEDKVFVRQQLSLKEDDIKRDVRILKEWLKKQPHLPRGCQSDSFFEHILIKNKGRVEKTKQNIDMYYTIKTLWADIFEGVENVRPSKFTMVFFPLPYLTKDKKRIWLGHYYKDQDEPCSMFEVVKQLCALLEVLNKYDYSSGLHIIVDLTNFGLDTLKTLTPNYMQKAFVALSDVYSHRVAGLYLYKPPKWIELLLNLLKAVVKPKIYNRISLHHDLESLLKMLPEDSLPSEFGGKQATMKEMAAEWDKLIIDHEQFLKEIQKLKSNEKLRVGECRFDTEMFGVDGTFKKLNLD